MQTMQRDQETYRSFGALVLGAILTEKPVSRVRGPPIPSVHSGGSCEGSGIWTAGVADWQVDTLSKAERQSRAPAAHGNGRSAAGQRCPRWPLASMG